MRRNTKLETDFMEEYVATTRTAGDSKRDSIAEFHFPFNCFFNFLTRHVFLVGRKAWLFTIRRIDHVARKHQHSLATVLFNVRFRKSRVIDNWSKIILEDT